LSNYYRPKKGDKDKDKEKDKERIKRGEEN
jgi:hypothetical protein